MNKVLSFADIVSKPVVAIFLGADEKLYEGTECMARTALRARR